MLLQIGSLNHNIIPADVRSGHIVYHLFAVFGVGIIGVLLYARDKRGFRMLKHVMCFRNETSVSAACICRNNSARNEADRQHDTKEERKNLFEQLFSHHFSTFHFSPS